MSIMKPSSGYKRAAKRVAAVWGAWLVLLAGGALLACGACAASKGPAAPSGRVAGGLSARPESGGLAGGQAGGAGGDMAPAAAHQHAKTHAKYYMYAEAPKKGAYKMGFRRGNHKHQVERKEWAHKGHVHSHFKWHDKKGKGEHKFEFKHQDKKAKKHHY